MALDGLSVYALSNELSNVLENCKIEKVSQPTKYEFVLVLRKKSFNHKLLINISSNNPRIHFLNENRENPKTPPMFCMFLRKHLVGSVIKNVISENFERLIIIELAGYDEMGFQTTKYLAIELLGKFSNLILYGEDKRILDLAKRVDFESSTRPLLPNIFYTLPPKQNKISILDIDESFAQTVENSADLVSKIFGMSPMVANTLFDTNLDIFKINLENFKNYINSNNINCYILYKNGQPFDFSIIPIKGFESVKQDNFSFMLCDFFEKKDKVKALNSQHKELLKTVKNLIKRQQKKLVIQNEEILQTSDRDVFKNYADLIISNLYNISESKSTSIKLINYFDENMQEIEIPLDNTKTPKQNADKYYTKYHKLKTAEEILTREIIKGEDELIYLESVLESIERSENTSELLEIKEELIENRYIKQSKTKKKSSPSIANKYISSDGFTIYSGKNNVQNDTLTLKTARKTDLWFHTQKIHGTHVILITNGEDVPENTIFECAKIAAFNSKARTSSNIPVDFCPVRNVRKPKGSKAGMVIYDNYNTVYVTPDEKEILKLKVN